MNIRIKHKKCGNFEFILLKIRKKVCFFLILRGYFAHNWEYFEFSDEKIAQLKTFGGFPVQDKHNTKVLEGFRIRISTIQKFWRFSRSG